MPRHGLDNQGSQPLRQRPAEARDVRRYVAVRDPSYDWARRLVSVDQDYGAKTWGWTYDATGNMTTRTDAAGSHAYAYTGQAPHAVSAITTTGSVVASPRSFTYDTEHRITRSSGPGGSVAFEYGPDGERLAKTWLDGSGHEVQYFGTEYERSYDGVLWHEQLYVTAGGQRLAYITDEQPDKVFFLHPDVQGTIGLVLGSPLTGPSRPIALGFVATFTSSDRSRSCRARSGRGARGTSRCSEVRWSSIRSVGDASDGT